MSCQLDLTPGFTEQPVYKKETRRLEPSVAKFNRLTITIVTSSQNSAIGAAAKFSDPIWKQELIESFGFENLFLLSSSVVDQQSKTESPYVWTTSQGDILSASSIVGSHGIYPAGGFNLDIHYQCGPASSSRALHSVKNGYIDNQTRSVLIELVWFNLNVRKYAQLTLGLEIDPFGGVSTLVDMDTSSLNASPDIYIGDGIWLLRQFVIVFFYISIVLVLLLKVFCLEPCLKRQFSRHNAPSSKRLDSRPTFCRKFNKVPVMSFFTLVLDLLIGILISVEIVWTVSDVISSTVAGFNSSLGLLEAQISRSERNGTNVLNEDFPYINDLANTDLIQRLVTLSLTILTGFRLLYGIFGRQGCFQQVTDLWETLEDSESEKTWSFSKLLAVNFCSCLFIFIAVVVLCNITLTQTDTFGRGLWNTVLSVLRIFIGNLSFLEPGVNQIVLVDTSERFLLTAILVFTSVLLRLSTVGILLGLTYFLLKKAQLKSDMQSKWTRNRSLLSYAPRKVSKYGPTHVSSTTAASTLEKESAILDHDLVAQVPHFKEEVSILCCPCRSWKNTQYSSITLLWRILIFCCDMLDAHKQNPRKSGLNSEQKEEHQAQAKAFGGPFLSLDDLAQAIASQKLSSKSENALFCAPLLSYKAVHVNERSSKNTSQNTQKTTKSINDNPKQPEWGTFQPEILNDLNQRPTVTTQTPNYVLNRRALNGLDNQISKTSHSNRGDRKQGRLPSRDVEKLEDSLNTTASSMAARSFEGSWYQWIILFCCCCCPGSGNRPEVEKGRLGFSDVKKDTGNATSEQPYTREFPPEVDFVERLRASNVIAKQIFKLFHNDLLLYPITLHKVCFALSCVHMVEHTIIIDLHF